MTIVNVYMVYTIVNIGGMVIEFLYQNIYSGFGIGGCERSLKTEKVNYYLSRI